MVYLIHLSQNNAKIRYSSDYQTVMIGSPYIRQDSYSSSQDKTSLGGRMSKASATHSGRSGNPKPVGSNLDVAFSNPDRVKPMSLKFKLVAS